MERIRQAWADHGRQFGQYRYVYPVISRRAKGISLGINLNPDLACNFDCPYCQVDRTGTNPPEPKFSMEGLQAEIEHALGHWMENRFTDSPRFQGIPLDQLDLKDLCMSGDGEPTMEPMFPKVCELLLQIQSLFVDHPIKLVLITNATLLHQEKVREGLRVLTSQSGEIWGKLDAGTEPWFQRMSRSRYRLDQIEANLHKTVADFPLRIQTMLCTVDGAPPDQNELDAWMQRIQRIYQTNPKNLLEVQLYSVIRRTATETAGALPSSFLQDVAAMLGSHIPVPVGVYS